MKHKLHSAKHNPIQKLNGKNDIKLITAYAAAKIIYTNSQRSGVIQNLTIEEYELRIFCDDECVIPCTHHKTGPQGWAQLVVTKEDHILNYKDLVRDRIKPQQGCENFFNIIL